MKPQKATQITGIERRKMQRIADKHGIEIARAGENGTMEFTWGNLSSIKFFDTYSKISILKSVVNNPIVFSFIVNKGGEGKTTNNINMANAFSGIGKTLIIDGDGQGNTSEQFGILDGVMLQDALEDNEKIYDAIRPVDGNDNLFILPNNIDFHEYLRRQKGRKAPFILLKLINYIKKHLDFDFIWIDSPPALDIALELILFSLDYAILTYAAEPQAYKGVFHTIAVCNEIKMDEFVPNINLEILGILFNRIKHNSSTNKIWMDRVKEEYETFDTIIRSNEDIPKAQNNMESIMHLRRDSKAGLDAYNLFFEIIEKIIKLNKGK